MNYPYYYGHSFGSGEFLLHFILTIFIIWIVFMVIRTFVWGRRGRRWRHRSMWQHSSALEIIDERYAKGEISKEEYEERRKTLLGE